MTGPNRIRNAIARDRGHFAPNQPVALCGTANDTAVRADWAPPLPRIPRRHQVGERIAAALFCPACLLPRFVPGHRFRGCR